MIVFDQVRFSWLDVKLGFRMLVKHPELTLIGGFAIAFAVWVGAGTFEIVSQVVDPKIPLDEGNRLIAIRQWDVARNRREPRAVHDFTAWRQQLQTIDDLAAYRASDRTSLLAMRSVRP